ncbi:MAG: NAD(+) synthase [Planctomycetes bacterium]|nr:NAD(+) synthase [Planctomycetota bacterium]
MSGTQGLHPWLRIDAEATVAALACRLRDAVHGDLRRKGAVVALSGGIDSSVSVALAARALGPDRVLALLLPERESSQKSRELGELVAGQLGVPRLVEDLTAPLEAIGCYRRRDEAVRALFPDYGPGWKSKIAAAEKAAATGRFTWFRLVVESPAGERREKRMPLREYLEIVAATSFKQRLRKAAEYFHADRLHFAVVGTPNRLEYDQGFFVKNGDGAADVKPIAHLYKSQVYELGRFLGLPEPVLHARPTTDTYSLEQGQDEFYFVLPHATMDLVLFGLNHGRAPEEIASETGLALEHVRLVLRDILDRRRATAPLHRAPILLAPVPEVEANAAP